MISPSQKHMVCTLVLTDGLQNLATIHCKQIKVPMWWVVMTPSHDKTITPIKWAACFVILGCSCQPIHKLRPRKKVQFNLATIPHKDLMDWNWKSMKKVWSLMPPCVRLRVRFGELFEADGDSWGSTGGRPPSDYLHCWWDSTSFIQFRPKSVSQWRSERSSNRSASISPKMSGNGSGCFQILL